MEPKGDYDPSAGPRTHKARPLSALARAARIVDAHRTRYLNHWCVADMSCVSAKLGAVLCNTVVSAGEDEAHANKVLAPLKDFLKDANALLKILKNIHA